VTVDALVLQKNTARVVGGLKKEDFVLRRWDEAGDYALWQDSSPSRWLLLIESRRLPGSFGSHVHRAASEAIAL